MGSIDDLETAIEQSHEALLLIINGDPDGFITLFSNQEDVTLANPFGPIASGRLQVVETIERAASFYRDGVLDGFESMAKYSTPELAYIVEVERFKAKVGQSDDLASASLRVTSVFRREEGSWKLVHRHADPITTPRQPESVLQS